RFSGGVPARAGFCRQPSLAGLDRNPIRCRRYRAGRNLVGNTPQGATAFAGNLMINVIFASDHNAEPQDWIEPLQRELPDVRIVNWDDNGAAVDARLAVVWNPPE